MRKGKDPDPDPYLWLTDQDQIWEGQKHEDLDQDAGPEHCLKGLGQPDIFDYW
jgi:hypothetical protein